MKWSTVYLACRNITLLTKLGILVKDFFIRLMKLNNCLSSLA